MNEQLKEQIDNAIALCKNRVKSGLVDIDTAFKWLQTDINEVAEGKFPLHLN